MKTYNITVSFTVDAHDYDEAGEIAKDARGTMSSNSSYKLRDVETQRIEEES